MLATGTRASQIRGVGRKKRGARSNIGKKWKRRIAAKRGKKLPEVRGTL